MHLTEKLSFLGRVTQSGPRYRIIQILLIVPAVVFLCWTIYSLCFATCPVTVGDERVEKIETSLGSLSSEVTKIQGFCGENQDWINRDLPKKFEASWENGFRHQTSYRAKARYFPSSRNKAVREETRAGVSFSELQRTFKDS